MRHLFIHFKPLSLTSDMLFGMSPAKFLLEGSNSREAALMDWVNYIQEIEGKLAR